MEDESPWGWSPTRPEPTPNDKPVSKPPPNELLDPGMEWKQVGEVRLSTYNTYRVAAAATRPEDLADEDEAHARLQGSVELNGELWKYNANREKWPPRPMSNPCLAGGGVPLQNYKYCTHTPYTDSSNNNIVYVTGAVQVAEDKDSWFEQGEAPVYVTYGQNPQTTLVVTPIDACRDCKANGIDIYTGFSTRHSSIWLFGPFGESQTLWEQVLIGAR